MNLFNNKEKLLKDKEKIDSQLHVIAEKEQREHAKKKEQELIKQQKQWDMDYRKARYWVHKPVSKRFCKMILDASRVEKGEDMIEWFRHENKKYNLDKLFEYLDSVVDDEPVK